MGEESRQVSQTELGIKPAETRQLLDIKEIREGMIDADGNPSFFDIPKLSEIQKTPETIFFGSFLTRINQLIDEYHLNLSPDFQRKSVWTDEQRKAYVEHLLVGGRGGLDFFFNQPGWHSGESGELVVVDGKQRIETLLKFFNNELHIFGDEKHEGFLFSQFTDRPRMADAKFEFHIAEHENKDDLYRWYIFLNSGGTPHTSEEIKKVKGMMGKDK